MFTRMDRIVDDYHGTTVSDPYRWLENSNDLEVKEWVEMQNAETQGFLKSIEVRRDFRRRLTELWNYARTSVPIKVNSWYFYEKNTGLQNQPVLCRQKGLKGTEEVVLDPNLWSSDGSKAISTFSVDESGKYLAYSTTARDSNVQEIRIRDLDGNKDFPEVIKGTKFTSIAWLEDRGFYYSGCPEFGSVSAEDKNNHNGLYWHELGTEQNKDVLIYEEPEDRELCFFPRLTSDQRYLVLSVFSGSDSLNGVYYKELEKDKSFNKLIEPCIASFELLGVEGTEFYFLTNSDAPQSKIIGIDLKNPSVDNWKEILPEQKDSISSAVYVNGEFVIDYMHDAYSVVRIFNPAEGSLVDLNLPAMAAVRAISGKQNQKELFIQFSSFLDPPTNFRYDFETRQLTPFGERELRFKADDYMVSQVFYSSKDGTEIPMFIVHKRDLNLNGENPTILSGYGGFSVPVKPYFSASLIFWLELGGVYAVANLRGGGEYGTEWARGGMLENKQNVFDDFISGAEWLISNGYTSSRLLAIEGRNNGGLTVSASMVQRPELFGAVICHVPITDMLRYHKFKIGRGWLSEYGNAEENKEHFEFIFKYSPLHNVHFTAYPATLVVTADRDDRVSPAHAYKFTATLQAAQQGTAPILCRIDERSGHERGKSLAKIVDEQVDIYAFLVKVFEMRMPIFNWRINR